MNQKAVPEQISIDDGPFSYVYLAVSAVPGMLYPKDVGETVLICSFTERNAEVFLTQDWDRYCIHMDRSTAIAVLMLSGFRGHRRFGRLSQYWDRLIVRLLGNEAVFLRNLEHETTTVRQQRHKEHKSPGSYLIYRAEGALIEPVDLRIARRIGRIGFGFDNIRREKYREIHRLPLHATTAALSLAVAESNGSPDIHFVGDICYLKGKDDLAFYPKTVEGGSVSAIVSSKSAIDHLESAKQYIPAMLDDSRIDAAISLFAQSQNKENDNLRSFIAAWSSLELLVNRLAKVTRPKWEELLQTGSLPTWDRDLKDVLPEDYRQRDRFFAVACVLDHSAASSDVDVFVRANSMRSEFYHRLAVKDTDLPTENVRVLFRKYLRLSLSYRIKGDRPL